MSGLASGGSSTVKLKQQYDKERLQMITSGEPVLTFEEWLKKQGIAPPPNLAPESYKKAGGKKNGG